MTIQNFIKGHKYIYLGVTVPMLSKDTESPPWSWISDMEFALLPQVLTCKNDRAPAYQEIGDNQVFASFEEEKEDVEIGVWDWGVGIENWIDVTDMPEKDIQKILAEKRKLMVAEKI